MAARPRVQHVSIPKPAGSRAEATAFYSDILGLQEVPVPTSIQHLDLIWYGFGDQELHLFTGTTELDQSGRHLCIEVDDLTALREKLIAAGYSPEDTTAIPGRPRFFCGDPFGNRLEFTTIEGNYLDHQ